MIRLAVPHVFFRPLSLVPTFRLEHAARASMSVDTIVKQATAPLWEDEDAFDTYDYKMDVTGAPDRASTLSISHLPFVLFSGGRTRPGQSTKPLHPSDIDFASPFTPITPLPPLPMLRQAVQQTLPQPRGTPHLPTGTASDSEPRLSALRPSISVVSAGRRLPRLLPVSMAAPTVSIQAGPMGPQLPQVGPVPSSSGPQVRPLPQRPPTANPIDDEDPWAESDDNVGRPSRTQTNEIQSDSDANALRRNRHIRRAQRAPLNGPRALPPLPGTNLNTSTLSTVPHDPTSKRTSSPVQPVQPRALSALQRSKSDPTSPLPRGQGLSLVIPRFQAADSSQYPPLLELIPTTPSPSEDESSGTAPKKPQRHSLDYFPTIDYASVATPSASRRPPPSAYPDGGKENGTLLDWHLLEEALGVDTAIIPADSPISVSFLPSPGAPPVPAIPDRFLADRE
jgi:hypothetical protein